MRGILFDLPAVVKDAPSFIKSYGLESRIDVRSGNFFESIPGGADAYLLKQILHDWNGEDCLRILKQSIFLALDEAYAVRWDFCVTFEFLPFQEVKG
jgi:hypothetical protein